MKTPRLVVLLCCMVSGFSSAAPKSPTEPKHYTVYAQFLDKTAVDLSTGAKWMMDKGDCFPVYMFKEQQTVVVLNLGGATFSTDASNVRIMKDSEAGTAVQSYRKNVAQFLKTQSDKWKTEAGGTSKDKSAEPGLPQR